MGKAKAQTRHLRKNGTKRAQKQTILAWLKKRGDPPASTATEPLQIQVSSPRPRLSSDPEKKRKLNTTTEHKQKNHAQKCMVIPPTPSQSTPGQKQSPKKTKPNAWAEHLRGQGEQKGAKKPAQAERALPPIT